MADPVNIGKLRRLHEEATPGEWFKVGIHASHEFRVIGSARVVASCACLDEPQVEADAAFIVAARNALPALLDEVERMRAMHRRVMDELDAIADTVPGDEAGPHFGVAEWHKMVLAENAKLRAENSAMRLDVADAMPFLPVGRGSLKDAAMDLEMERDEAREVARKANDLVLNCAEAAGVWSLSDTISPEIAATFPQRIRDEVERLRAELERRERMDSAGS